MRMYKTLLTGALVALVALAVGLGDAPGASADRAGVPSVNACHGQVISILASDVGLTPAEATQIFGFANAGEYNGFIIDICG